MNDPTNGLLESTERQLKLTLELIGHLRIEQTQYYRNIADSLERMKQEMTLEMRAQRLNVVAYQQVLAFQSAQQKRIEALESEIATLRERTPK